MHEGSVATERPEDGNEDGRDELAVRVDRDADRGDPCSCGSATPQRNHDRSIRLRCGIAAPESDGDRVRDHEEQVDGSRAHRGPVDDGGGDDGRDGIQFRCLEAV